MLGEYTIFVSTELYCGVSGETRKPPFIYYIFLWNVYLICIYSYLYILYIRSLLTSILGVLLVIIFDICSAQLAL
jgi:hypothetical protein